MAELVQPLAIMLLAAHQIVHLNAVLNATATVLLVVGLLLIKQGRVTAHKRTMLAAFAVSIAFLACYLWYHNQVGHVEFTHPGTVRYVYYAILATHIPLAFSVPVLAIWTIYLGVRAEKEIVPVYRTRHRRLARWTLPIWLYVSVTGVVIYVMLYHLFPPLE
jgi:putative membrane protein